MVDTSHEVGYRHVKPAGHLVLTTQCLGPAGQVRFPAEGFHLPAAVVRDHRLDNISARVDDNSWRTISTPDVLPCDTFIHSFYS